MSAIINALPTIIVGSIVFGVLVLALRSIYKAKKNGNICGSCTGCTGCDKSKQCT